MIAITDIRKELAGKYKNPLLPVIPQRALTDLNGVVIHCTDDPDSEKGDDVYGVARYHTESPNHISPNGCPSIAYSYYIEHDKNGQTVCWKCLGDTDIGWHAGDVIYHKKSWNKHFLGIVIDYKSDQQLPEDKEKVASAIVALKCIQFGWNPDNAVLFHRDVVGSGCYFIDDKGHVAPSGKKVYRKSCPGWNLDHTFFVSNVRRDILTLAQETGLVDTLWKGMPTKPEDIWSEQSRNAIKIFQSSNYLEVNGILDEPTIAKLNLYFNLKFTV